MKILLLCYEYPPIGGGGGVGAQQYAEAWARAGHEVKVITSGAPGLPAREIVAGVDLIRVYTGKRKDRATTSFLAMLLYNLTAFAYVGKHRREFRSCDLINTHFSIPTGPMAWLAAKTLGIPNVLTIIGGDIYDPSKRSSPHRHFFFRLVNRWILNSADRLIAISSDTKARAKQYYRVRQPIQVINYGFAPLAQGTEVALDPPLAEGKFHLIAVGRLVPRKGFDVLIRALARLPEEVELLLVGDGPEEQALRRLAAQNGVSGRVRLLGFQPRGAIHRLLRMADCFVLSSWHEGLGIVVQEAMDAGLPVIATNNGGQVDLIKQERNGLLVEPGNEESLADAIRRLHADPALARSMGRNNLEDVSSLYMDLNQELYLTVFSELDRSTRPLGTVPAPLPQSKVISN
jgi:L-malate glycosyltransferase